MARFGFLRLKGGDQQHPMWMRLHALAVGLICHLVFLFAVGSMMYSLGCGLNSAVGPLTGVLAIGANAVLVLQFPLLHSWLLTRQGRNVLTRLSPKATAQDMAVTWFALIASIQLLLVFWLWSPSGKVLWRADGNWRWVSLSLFGSAWLLLFRAMIDADITLQSGLKGWFAVARNRRPFYGDFPQGGLFRACRQPIYLAFALILWTTPVFSYDVAILAVVWSFYCIAGPLLKESRYRKRYGERYTEYQQRVPYFTPNPKRLIQMVDRTPRAGRSPGFEGAQSRELDMHPPS